MNQQAFVQRYESQWERFERLLEHMERKAGKRKPEPADFHEFPFRYRRLCQQLALARDRDYAAYIIDRLNQLVLSGHQHLYESRAGVWSRAMEVAVHGFPARVREDALLFWLAALLMFGPTIGVGLMVHFSPDFVYAVMDAGQVEQFEEMYDSDSEHLWREDARQADGDFLMFGFYVRNNVGVGFRTFAAAVAVRGRERVFLGL